MFSCDKSTGKKKDEGLNCGFLKTYYVLMWYGSSQSIPLLLPSSCWISSLGKFPSLCMVEPCIVKPLNEIQWQTPDQDCGHISRLPDHPIHGIFSFLEVKEMMRRYLCTWSPYLIFSPIPRNPSKLFVDRFWNFVNKVLVLNSAPIVHEFHIEVPYDRRLNEAISPVCHRKASIAFFYTSSAAPLL